MTSEASSPSVDCNEEFGINFIERREVDCYRRSSVFKLQGAVHQSACAGSYYVTISRGSAALSPRHGDSPVVLLALTCFIHT